MSEVPTPEQIGADYFNSLAALTNNSKPIIDSHTTIAQENIDAATEIVKAIEKRINKAIPNQKIWLLYLLDSISKNVGPPYTTLFGSNIYKTFTNVYSLVDDPTRIKLIRLFETWRIPSPSTGLPLFPESQIDSIDSFLVKATSNNQRSSTPNGNGATLHLTPTILAGQIREVQTMVNKRLLRMPNDHKANERSKVLSDLLRIITTQKVSTQQLETVKKQVDMVHVDEKRQLEEYSRQQLQQQQQQQAMLQQFLPNNNANGVNSPLPNFSPQQLTDLLKLAPNNNSQQQYYQQFNNNNNANPIMNNNTANNNNNNNNNNANVQNIMSFMNALTQQQKLQSPIPQQRQATPQIPVPATSTPNSNPAPIKSPKPASTGLASASSLDFLQSLVNRSKQAESNGGPDVSALSLLNANDPKFIISKFQLSQSFINNHKLTPNEIDMIFDRKPNKCSNCSKRFPNTAKGSNDKKLHLDWHFRINKKLKNSDKKTIQNRAWLLNDEAWIKFNEDEIIGSSGLEENTNASNNLKDDNKSLEEDAKNKYVVVFDDSPDNTITCGVCREKLVGVFDDDLGEWIWKNAINVKERGKDKVYHYTCYVQTKGGKRDRSPERNNTGYVNRS